MIYSFPDFNRTSYNSNERRMFGYVILSNTKKWVLSSLLGNSHFLVFISEFSFVFVVSIPSQAGQTHNLGIAEIAIKFLGEFSDYLFRFDAFPGDDDTVLLTTNLFPFRRAVSIPSLVR